MGRLKLCSVTAVAALIAATQLVSAAPVDQAAMTINRGVVELETSGAAGGGICEIDPSACPKQEDIAKAANKKINAEIYAVEQICLESHHLPRT